MEIRVKCEESLRITGATKDIVMIPFTGEATGPFFTGHVKGTGVDTQKIEKNGTPFLSARYVLEGKDYAGNACSVFVENQGSWGGTFVPMIVTDSPVLSEWETADLYAEVNGLPGGVLVKVYMRGK